MFDVYRKNSPFRIFKASLIFFLLLTAEICIGFFIQDNFIRPYLGDTLVIVLIYSFIRIFYIRKNILLPFYILMFGILTEIGQNYKIIDVLNINNKVLRVIIGSTYDTKDILCYFIGFLAILYYEVHIYSRGRKAFRYNFHS